MGYTEAEWLACLPRALQHWTWNRLPSDAGGNTQTASSTSGAVGAEASAQAGGVQVQFHQGLLRLQWRALPARCLASIALPCLWVRFDFCDTDEATRQHFLRHFDLYTHRGGG